ncbi:MAG: hypothetical protein ABIA75_14975 [Candidatus Neomarinimicrobiota bacterium]
MRHHFNYSLLLLLCLAVTACIEDLNFIRPQPDGVKNTSHFSPKFLGTYFCWSDSSTLTIFTDHIIQHWHAVEVISRAELDTMSDIKVIDNLIHCDEFPEPLAVEFFGDSARVTIDFDEPFFTPDDDQLLRWYKGYYFLNYRGENDLWTIKALKLDKAGKLTVHRFDAGDDDMKVIRAITTVEEIRPAHAAEPEKAANPSRKELKKLMKADLFKIDTEFQKGEN